MNGHRVRALGNLDDRRSFEELLMDIWALRESEARRAALRRLGDALSAARSRYEDVKVRNEDLFGELNEGAVA